MTIEGCVQIAKNIANNNSCLSLGVNLDLKASLTVLVCVNKSNMQINRVYVDAPCLCDKINQAIVLFKQK